MSATPHAPIAPGTHVAIGKRAQRNIMIAMITALVAVIAAMSVMAAPDLMVLEPVWLRDEVRAAALRTLEHYPG